ncbi:DJ-1/PfpI family protein [Sphingosinicella microcystinivorans]|uniref:Cyclohexyl-isocyanide hydratase n=1 Tax=Sphingosinicella microcystinivorans TaxID=335406 RepID=A0AAD1G2N4_SPHMI|nr:DJ-1/PfpI family protein [Sphingosinicella microcystinivorans]RKS88201.1 cyclohexyl-isocyanide hydratase [Sphingosinicella microcystinivorans]BBE36013.1 dimethylglycine dehydrogenase [Sphingosinicella microcystinivorans]
MTETFNIGFLLYPELTQLDMTGPAQVLARMPGAKLHFVWKTMDPIPDDCGLTFLPTATFADCPQLDMICVPGGYGTSAVMQDEVALSWLRRQAEGAQFITSVCTGSLILAAAGLMTGYKAACHWAWRDLLPQFGVIPVADRVVEDRNRISGGGVTAGIDFAFHIAEKLHGRDVAEMLQLVLEYDPAPLSGGTPETARKSIVDMTRAAMTARGFDLRRTEISSLASAR